MKAKPRYLTKSRFKLALECPTKLFYTGKEDIYPNSNIEDPFLQALADGGYQVGELAKEYYAPGINVETLDYTESEKQTIKLLEEKNINIFESAIRYKNLFVRIDILVKKGKKIELIEVKAKSFDPTSEDDQFISKKTKKISNAWKPYLYDIAFQKYVFQKAYPEYEVEAFLLLADKSTTCGTDGLNQKFKIEKDKNDRTRIVVSSELSKEDLKKQILVKIPVDEYVELILSDKTPFASEKNKSFEKEVNFLSQAYEKDEQIASPIGAKCKGCEYTCSDEEEKEGKKSGFKECFKRELKWKNKDFLDDTILDLWDCRKKDNLIEEGKIKLKDLDMEDIGNDAGDGPGLSRTQRQWLQVEKSVNNDKTYFFDKEGLAHEMKKWKFPLHFIDFETTMVAIPFNKGRRPYEGIAFQFSHHTVSKDGTVEHKGEFLHTTRGVFPNYEFLRALKKELEKDKGTIFRYSPHENTYLNMIYVQLKADKTQIQDKNELLDFIREITTSGGQTSDKWNGPRSMVDLLPLVKRHYYDPYTNGSNSIKYVLPAILNSSGYLQKKYSKPIYGAKDGIKSFNFKNKSWIEFKNGKIVDPYKTLPPIFSDISPKEYETLMRGDEINNGGAALTAYAKMQFTEMNEKEREALSQALLRYCELDTLAMVMIYEAWREWIKE